MRSSFEILSKTPSVPINTECPFFSGIDELDSNLRISSPRRCETMLRSGSSKDSLSFISPDSTPYPTGD